MEVYMKLSTFNYNKEDVIGTSLSLGVPFTFPTNKEKSKVYANCGAGYGCSGGGGQCGAGYGCGGHGGTGGHGQCGAGYGCSGGGGQCGAGFGCSGW